MKKMLFCLVGAFLCFTLANAANAITVTDVYPLDMNHIQDVISIPGAVTVNEDYNEDDLIPYTSHDGWAVVNIESPVQFFDKVVDLESDPTPLINFVFKVLNTSPYKWSDYHFEFYDDTFTTPLPFYVQTASSTEFSFVDPGGFFIPGIYSSVNFWNGEVANGEIVIFQLTLDNVIFSPKLPQSFGIRQIATTNVPVPAALLLLGSGLIGFAGFKRRFRT